VGTLPRCLLHGLGFQAGCPDPFPRAPDDDSTRPDLAHPDVATGECCLGLEAAVARPLTRLRSDGHLRRALHSARCGSEWRRERRRAFGFCRSREREPCIQHNALLPSRRSRRRPRGRRKEPRRWRRAGALAGSRSTPLSARHASVVLVPLPAGSSRQGASAQLATKQDPRQARSPTTLALGFGDGATPGKGCRPAPSGRIRSRDC
jgi:hypothetical protein